MFIYHGERKKRSSICYLTPQVPGSWGWGTGKTQGWGAVGQAPGDPAWSPTGGRDAILGVLTAASREVGVGSQRGSQFHGRGHPHRRFRPWTKGLHCTGLLLCSKFHHTYTRLAFHVHGFCSHSNSFQIGKLKSRFGIVALHVKPLLPHWHPTRMAALLPIQYSVMFLGRQWEMAHVFGSLSPAWWPVWSSGLLALAASRPGL